MSFGQFFLKESYKEIEELGDKLACFKNAIDWGRFRPIIASVYQDNKETGGRPHTDEIVIARALVLQAMYNLSDPELEFQCHDRLSFRNFIGFPENVPDFTTIWNARERLKNSGKEKAVWDELQRQLNAKGFTVKKGVIQDATFIQAEGGRTAKSERREGSSHMDRDATFTAKNNQVIFGYKTHAKIDAGHMLIRGYEVTTASTHDNRIDLVRNGDGAAYRDKGYFGRKLSAGRVKDMTMDRAVRGRKLDAKQKQRNWRITRIRSPGERMYAVIKNTFDGWYTLVKTLERVRVKEMFKCFAYNLYQLRTLSG